MSISFARKQHAINENPINATFDGNMTLPSPPTTERLGTICCICKKAVKIKMAKSGILDKICSRNQILLTL